MSVNNKNYENPQTVGDFIFWGENFLKNHQIPNPKLESELLLAFILGKNRIWLKTNLKEILTTEQQQKLREILAQRKQKIPLAYILGYKIWNNLEIEVSPAVLIPRDETEILMTHILETSRDFPIKKILDIGTGSGCIALFLQKNFPPAQVLAVDISAESLKIAQKNAQKHQTEINFRQSDLLSGVQENNFDLIVANLPYVPADLAVSAEVKQEPARAIFSGKDGLDLIRKLAEQLKSREISFKELWLEFLPQQANQIAEIFADYSVEFYPDLAGDIYFARII